MSWAHVRRAIESELKGLDKLVYIMIANHVNDDPKHAKCGLAWPSVTLLAKETGIGRSTVNRVLNRLEAGGYLAREHHGTRSTHYRLSVPERDTNAPARERPTAVEVPERDTNALMAQSGIGGVPERDSGCPRAGHKPPKYPPNEPEKEKPPSGGASASLRALGSEQPDPTRASRMTALAPGNGGVKSVPADNEEDPCNSFEEPKAEANYVKTRRGGTGTKWSSQENRRSRLIAFGEPPEKVRAMSDSEVNVTLAWHMGQEESEKNGPKPNAALTSGTANGAPCQEP